MTNSERFIISGSVRQTAYLQSPSVQQRLSVNNVEGGQCFPVFLSFLKLMT